MSRVGNCRGKSRLEARTLGLAAGNLGGSLCFVPGAPGDPGLGLTSGPQGGISFLAGVDANPLSRDPLGGGTLGMGAVATPGGAGGIATNTGGGFTRSSLFLVAGLVGGGFLGGAFLGGALGGGLGGGLKGMELFGAGGNLGGFGIGLNRGI